MTSNPPAVQQVAGAVIVQGDCLHHVIAGTLSLMREMQRNGFAPPPALADLLTKAHAARMSADGHKFARYVAAETDSNSQGGDDWIDTTEAARLLGVSVRQARRLALDSSPGLSKRMGDVWALRRTAVLALAEERRKQK